MKELIVMSGPSGQAEKGPIQDEVRLDMSKISKTVVDTFCDHNHSYTLASISRPPGK